MNNTSAIFGLHDGDYEYFISRFREWGIQSLINGFRFLWCDVELNNQRVHCHSEDVLKIYGSFSHVNLVHSAPDVVIKLQKKL